MKSKGRNLNSAAKPNKEPKLSRTHAPADLSPVDWQRGLRRQFGREQAFGLENLSGEPFFSEFRVSNTVSKSSYRVAIRGLGPGGNFCSCPDYATSELGTCKHIDLAMGTSEASAPAGFFQIGGARPVIGKKSLKLGKRLRKRQIVAVNNVHRSLYGSHTRSIPGGVCVKRIGTE